VTTVAPTTTSTTASTVPPTTTAAPAIGLAAEVEDLIDLAEGIRGLGFLATPEIVILDPVEFATRVGLLVDRRDAGSRLEAKTLLFRLIGMLDDGDDLEPLRRRLQALPETAWYDASMGQLLVADRPTRLGPLERSEVVHEIVHALADQHYRWSEGRAALVAVDADDRLVAFDALVEGDATYFQLLYIQQLPAAEQDEIARYFINPSPDASGVPAWLLRDLAFPFDEGFEFVADLVAGGGIAAVDRAYLDPPVSSEHILHPDRYHRGESGGPIASPEASLEDYTALPAASFGEWGLRLLLERALSPGLLTQIVDGWGGDSYQIFTTGGGEVAFALLYLGDTEAHTEEVTQAFIDYAEDVLGLGDGERSGGGAVYSRNRRPWVFLDREGIGLLVVIASGSSAGRDLADQLAPPESGPAE
jgi:hypothetical protein